MDSRAMLSPMVSVLQALVLGLLQGLTEFLPISSSAHLILLPRFVDWPDQGLLFDVAANTGTLVAVLAYFREDLSQLVREAFDGKIGLLGWLIVASVPLGLCGLLFGSFIEANLRSPLLIATTTLVFGILLGAADFRARRPGERRSEVEELTWRDAVALGLMQALALVPGTSRSGITMTGGLGLGMDRELAARASFLMAIPAGGMVAVKGLMDLRGGAVDSAQMLPLLVVFVASAVSGWCVITLLLAWLRQRSLMVFVLYRLLLAALLY
ncbi:MAG: undecaprenyl-diphosphate phosphatase, partial [Acidobacteriota bacterium]